MSDVLAPALYALFIWWFGTGAVLLLDRLSRGTRRLTMVIATVAALAAIAGINATQDTRTLTAAVCAFSCAIVLWAWHELSFLSGVLTGPRKSPCPPGAKGFHRFVLAARTLIHHEIAIALSGVVLALWLWDATNPVALMTFGILWAMRLSAKLNLYLGAPNVAVEFLPTDLAYLTSYFSHRPMNGLFPVSVTVGTLASAWFFAAAAMPAHDVFATAVRALAGMLLALGTLEHWFLVLPYREAALWRWYMNNGGRNRHSSSPRSTSGAQRATKALDLTPPGASALPGS